MQSGVGRGRTVRNQAVRRRAVWSRQNRAVPTGEKPFEFVTGGPVGVVTRHEPTGGGRERPFYDAKRGGPC